MEFVPCIPTISSHSVFPYTFPAWSAQLSDIALPPGALKMHFSSSSSVRWTYGIDVLHEKDILLSIPQAGDVKLHMEQYGHTTYISIVPICKAEISAKEIRSRIKGHETIRKNLPEKQAPVPTAYNPGSYSLKIVSEKASVTSSLLTRQAAQSTFNSDGQKRSEKSEYEKKLQSVVKFDVSVKVSGFAFILIDENVLHGMREIACLTLGGFNCTWRTLTNLQTELLVLVAEIQLDNQLYGEGSFDFPVVMKTNFCQSTRRSSNVSNSNGVGSLDRFAQHALRVCLIMSGEGALMTVGVSVKPIQLFIEDKYISCILQIATTFVPEPSSCSSNHTKRIHVQENIVCLNRLTVDAVDMEVCLNYFLLSVYLACNCHFVLLAR